MLVLVLLLAAVPLVAVVVAVVVVVAVAAVVVWSLSHKAAANVRDSALDGAAIAVHIEPRANDDDDDDL